MDRILVRTLKLSHDEVQQAVEYWLINTRDIQIGSEPEFAFDQPGCACEITSSDASKIELTDD